jgi:hypothetical protein
VRDALGFKKYFTEPRFANRYLKFFGKLSKNEKNLKAYITKYRQPIEKNWRENGYKGN